MSSQSIRKSPSNCETQCPECGDILSRQADLNRHRKTRHSDGTENKFSCPQPGCPYKATQRGNLKAHADARHSDKLKYPCQECGDRFGDAAARIRHRKKHHGYKPYHTGEYLARQSQKGKESVARRVGKAVSHKTRRDRATSAAPYSLPHSPLSDAQSPKALKVTYHDDFWKTLIDMANHYAENPEELEELEHKINLPSANTAGHTPDATQPFPADAFIQPVATMQPLSPPSHLTSDTPGFIAPQLDAISPQGQASAWHPAQDNTSAVPSHPVFPPSPTGIDMTAFTPGAPPTYSGVDFLTHLGFPTPTQSHGDVLSSMPVAVTVPAISTSSAASADFKLPFTPTSCEPASLFDPAPGPSWSSTSSEATGNFMPVSHVPATEAGWSPTLSLAPFDLFAHEEASDFNTWCQSYPLS